MTSFDLATLPDPAFMARFAPHKPMIRAFVNALFKHADAGTYVSLRAFHGDSKPWSSRHWRSVKLDGKSFAALVDAAAVLAGKCANAPERPVFCPPIACFRSARGASERNLACGLVLTVELDKNAQAARELLESILGPATVVVASGGKWTNPDTGEISDKLHLHWRLSEPTRDGDAHTKLKEARRIAAQLVGADGTAINPVHPLRWPGSWHRKESPRLACIIALNDDAEIELDDALARLRGEAAAAGIEIGSNASANTLTADIRDVAAALAVIPNDDEEWVWWNNKIMLATWSATRGSEAGYRAFALWSAKPEKDDPAATRERWDEISRSPPDRIGAGTLFYEAFKADPHWRKPSEGDVFDVPESRLQFLSPEECAAAPARGYIVKGLIAPGDVACIFGPPGVGKSAVAPFIAYHVTLGDAVFALRTKPGVVFYVAAEDAHGMASRITALRRRFGEATKFRLITGLTDLLADDSPDRAVLLDAIAEQRPVLIIIDTLAMAFCDLDENDGKDMRRVVAVARSLTEHGAAVVLIHHGTKADGSTPRGHSVLNGALDVALQLMPADRGGVIRARLTKNRNGPCDIDLAFRINSEELGTDEDGDAITAAIAEPLPVGAVRREEKLSENEKAGFEVFMELVAHHEDGTGEVAGDRWRQVCDEGRRISTSPINNSRWRAIDRALKGLIQKKRIEIHNGQMRLAGSVAPDDVFSIC